MGVLLPRIMEAGKRKLIKLLRYKNLDTVHLAYNVLEGEFNHKLYANIYRHDCALSRG